jgi:ribosomal protein L29
LESNSLKLARLRMELDEAEWDYNLARIDALRREIARLELMIELGTHYDEPF